MKTVAKLAFVALAYVSYLTANGAFALEAKAAQR